MIDTGKRYHITDTRGNYYKIDDKNHLVMARDSSEATLFSIREANDRIGTGKISHFYNLVEAEDVVSDPVIDFPSKEPVYDFGTEEFSTPTLYDSLHNDWESVLENLSYMSDHITEYQTNLNQMLSAVDKEICDLMHYLEFNDLDDEEMLQVSKMLKDRRLHRREIKDEMEKISLMKATFLDGAFGIKVQQSLEVMERMKARKYTPRKLNDLFKQQVATA